MKLTWKATITEPTECPDYKPSLNPYTGEMEWPSTHCAVYHCTTREVAMEREFHDRAAAEAFVSSAPRSCTSFMLDGGPIETRPPVAPPTPITGSGIGGSNLIMNTGTMEWMKVPATDTLAT